MFLLVVLALPFFVQVNGVDGVHRLFPHWFMALEKQHDAVPENIIIQDVHDYLQNLPEVTGIHDLHVWALSTTDAALTVHLETNRQTDKNFIKSIQHQLHEKFDIDHITIQVEYEDHPEDFDNT